MINILNELDLDIKRCENLIVENNYLEIVIAIEELHDKYKNTVDSISNINSNVVWNYSKKDIENIQRSLREYKEELIFKANKKSIEDKIKDLKLYIEKNDLSEKSKLIEVINEIENINSENLGANKKWNKLKEYLEIIKNQEREIGAQLLEIIVFISKG